MSLPQATKEVGNHPANTSVIDPVNKTAQAADVERKLKFYGVIQAFREGRLPSNQQISETLDYVLNHSPVDETKLSHEGKQLVQDVRDIIKTAELMVEQKNADELFQNFVFHTQAVDANSLKDHAAERVGESQSLDKDKVKEDGNHAAKHLRTLLTLVLTNSEVRKLLSDFSVIGRDLLSIGASKASTLIAPPQHQLDRVDEPAPQDQFITHDPNHPDGQRVAVGVGSAARDAFAEYHQVQQQGFGAAREVGGRAQREAEEFKRADEEGDEETKEVKKRTDTFHERVPEEQRNSATEQYESGKKFFSEEYFPKERRDQFIFRLKKVVIECQKHADYQESMTWLLDYLGEYVDHARTTSTNLTSTDPNAVPENHKLKIATLELRTLLERFANNTSMDVIFDAINVLADDTRRDPELHQWFKNVDTYVRRVLLKPGFILQPQSDAEASRLRENGKAFHDDKYKSDFDNLFSSIGSWFKAMGDDPLNQRFGNDWARLTKDLLFDSEGSLKFKPELWNDIRRVIMPTLVQQVGYIPIPRIEYTDDALDLVVENLTLQGRNLFPNIIAVEAHNYMKFSPYDAITDDQHHKITFQLAQIQADMRDVAFYYRKKTGLPRMKDSGLADVILGGEGLSASVTIVFTNSTSHDKSSVFKVQDVHVKVDGGLKFSIRDSKHDFLYKTLRPLATALVKKQICKALKDGIVTALEYVDGQLVGVRDRMREAKADEGRSRSEVLQEVCLQDATSAASITSHGASVSTSHSQFKVVSNKRDSLLSDVGNPAGWVNRSAEKEAKVQQGHGWRSEAFNIVPTRN
ncbi:hypothetical protein FA13DRAFT_1643942 [Coprinellus micaceus]|uniref:Uncharacterized protein n=1 Tax=Coprinellus micaceus TaxID=71717 RepID=A0A4Y7SGJ8_COPMI|nr:hypothetical protein FA13DRAFT_1643942 [Coprinellus micaceus]